MIRQLKVKSLLNKIIKDVIVILDRLFRSMGSGILLNKHTALKMLQ